jgi:penicillin-binding protein 2
MARITLKDHFAESRLFNRRTIWSLFFIGILISITLARLVYLQVYNHKHYTTLSQDNRLKLKPIPPTRGLIYDRNKTVLAENLPSYRLEITPEQVKDMDALLKQLKQIINIRDDQLKQFRRHVKRKRPFDSIPLRFRLTDEEVARIAAIQHRLPGVQIIAGLSRQYPFGNSFAHVIGYVGRLDERDLRNLDATNYSVTTHTGKIGIEKQYESLLHGTVGYQQVETNAQGRILRVIQRTSPVPGEDIHLTLDAPLQAVAEQALEKYNGAIVVMNPQNGEILALVSKPGFDPNDFVNGIESAKYKALRDNDSQPLYNRALLGRYPPGSTLKPFLGLAGLKYGVVHEHLEQFCPGFYMLPGEERKFRDWKRSGHGTVNLDDAITQSCDVYFYDLALNLGIDRITPFLQAFGVGSKTGIDMPIENAGLLPSRQWKRAKKGQPWFPGETLNTGIGQGFVLTTPLQLATATAMLVNRGKVVIPHLLKKKNPGEANRDAPPLLKSVSKRHWDYIIKAMVHVVHGTRGTARRIKQKGYKIAGKTGTAQVFGLKQEEDYEEENIALKLRDHALFIAFAPVKKPRIVVSVVVENGGSGGAVAAPIAGKIIEHYMARNPS